VHTNEPRPRLLEVVEETEARCPVFNLLHEAAVAVEMIWIAEPEDESGSA